jgi:hypothetical protein
MGKGHLHYSERTLVVDDLMWRFGSLFADRRDMESEANESQTIAGLGWTFLLETNIVPL